MAETVLVLPFLLAVVLGTVQVALVGHVHTVLASVAAEGARRAGQLGSSAAEGAAYAQHAARAALGAAVHCVGAPGPPAAGAATVEVRCTGILHATALPVGDVTVRATGRALVEG